jgi:hypothetical protein
MFNSLKRAELLDLIQRCTWLLEYYQRTAGSPQSVKAFQAARDKALNDLAALTITDSPADPDDRERTNLKCPLSPTKSA